MVPSRMLFVRVTSNQPSLAPSQQETLLRHVSRAVAELFDKPERWVMTCLDPRATMTFAGSSEPIAYIEVKNIGTISPELSERVSETLSAIVGQSLGVDPTRIYLEISEADAARWGWDSGTFAR